MPDKVTKEEAVRRALGVEKEFWVAVDVPITGSLKFQEWVMAINEEEALKKAKQVVLDDGPDEYNSVKDYETALFSEWSAHIVE